MFTYFYKNYNLIHIFKSAETSNFIITVFDVLLENYIKLALKNIIKFKVL